MVKDECVLVDEGDVVTGHANKYTSHRFLPAQPRGLLHRAFSVFLFDPRGRLLLQQRASSKITFPSVWTNTCCSHQLHGHTPTEVDAPGDVAAGRAPGAARAALRKLHHELGVDPAQLQPAERFKFLTRLHYCAADTGGRVWGGCAGGCVGGGGVERCRPFKLTHPPTPPPTHSNPPTLPHGRHVGPRRRVG